MKPSIIPMLAVMFRLVERSASSPTIWNASKPIIPSESNINVTTDPQRVVWPWRSYKSSSYTPPNASIITNGKPLAPGYIFMTPEAISGSSAAEQSGGFILTDTGDLVYGLNIAGVTDFRKQRYNSSEYLTYWSGYNSNGANTGHGYGQVNFLSDTYESFVLNPDLHLNKLTNSSAANGSIDIHEHQITDRNTILVTAYNNTKWDLTSVNGSKNGWIVDSIIWELDIATEEVLFEWRAADHLPLSASHQPLISRSGNGTEAAPWDWFHVNSIERIGDNYVVNSRHHWAIYLVSGKNGSIIWTLEGQTGGSFGTLPSNGTFRWQHHARTHNVTASGLDLSLFDNHNQALNNGTGATKTLVYHLEFPASKNFTPQLTRRIETPSDPLYADSQGSYVPDLGNGNQFVGYGQLAISREYGPATDGSDLRWQAQFGGINTVQSYRGFKETWHATPRAWDPNLVVEYGKAYVSWNGATEVEWWNVYVGGKWVGKAGKKGFETVFDVPEGAEWLQVGAVQEGREVRRSNVVNI